MRGVLRSQANLARMREETQGLNTLKNAYAYVAEGPAEKVVVTMDGSYFGACLILTSES